MGAGVPGDGRHRRTLRRSEVLEHLRPSVGLAEDDDFTYVLGFEAPTERDSLRARLAYPFRAALAAASPWLLAKTLGGASLMVIGRVPRAAER